MKKKVVVLQTKNPRFPRACFLVSDLETVEAFLDNAFVFEGVQWHKIQNLVQIGNHPELYQLMQSSNYTWEEFFQNEYPYTMIPFESFPSPRGHKAAKTDLARLSTIGRNKYSKVWHDVAGAILLDEIDNVRVKMKGVLYNSPCEICKNFFSHLAGQCRLLAPINSGWRGTMCHMELFVRSDAVEGAKVEPSPETLPVTLA